MREIMRKMKDASTDIIVVSNELFCKEEMEKDFDTRRLTLQMPRSHPLWLSQAMKTSLQLIIPLCTCTSMIRILANNISILSDSLSQRP